MSQPRRRQSQKYPAKSTATRPTTFNRNSSTTRTTASYALTPSTIITSSASQRDEDLVHLISVLNVDVDRANSLLRIYHTADAVLKAVEQNDTMLIEEELDSAVQMFGSENRKEAIQFIRQDPKRARVFLEDPSASMRRLHEAGKPGPSGNNAQAIQRVCISFKLIM